MACSLSKSPSVAVIGAGMSGIAAAKQLMDSGFTNLTIFEASEKMGGRIRTQYLQDEESSLTYRLEMGANWIHGTHGNPVFEFAKANGLLNHQQREKDGWPKFTRYDWVNLTSDGEEIPPNFFKDVAVWYARKIEEIDNIYKSKHSPENESDYFKFKGKNLEETIRGAFEKFLSEKPQKDHYVYKQILNHKLAFETTLSGCDTMREASVCEFGSYVELKGPDPEVPGGFVKLVECLAKDIDREKIKFNCPVHKVDYADALKQSKTPGCISVQQSTGENAQFDHVIVTSSLNVLKNWHLSMFCPKLPKKKQHTLSKMAMGVVDKILLHFENLDFISPKCRIIRFAWPLEVDTTLWTSRLHSFSVINSPKQDILTAWLTGSAAITVESLSDDEVIDGCMEVLTGLLKNKNLPRPVKITRTKWDSEPYISGSYSYISVDGTVDDIVEFSKPILDASGKPLICFAGEHTHPEYYSTTHGAMLSGQREAKNIINYYAENQKTDSP